MQEPIPTYLDYSASTPPDPEVVEAMLPWLGAAHANPHSSHLHGHRASRAVEEAKNAIAELIEADPEHVILTSGSTESNNIVIQGTLGHQGADGVLVTSDLEHRSILEIARSLQSRGSDVRRVPVTRKGNLFSRDVGQAIAYLH